MIENAFLSATKLAEQSGDGSLSPVEWLEATVERANIVQSRLNPFRMIDPEQAREIARANERRWAEGNPLSPLDGVPVAIKDNQAIAGEPRTAGSRALEHLPPAAEDAPHWHVCAKPARFSTLARPCPISPGKRLPTARFPASRAIHGTRL